MKGCRGLRILLQNPGWNQHPPCRLLLSVVLVCQRVDGWGEREQGPHQPAQKSTRAYPSLVCSSKVAGSFRCITFSFAMGSPIMILPILWIAESQFNHFNQTHILPKIDFKTSFSEVCPDFRCLNLAQPGFTFRHACQAFSALLLISIIGLEMDSSSFRNAPI